MKLNYQKLIPNFKKSLKGLPTFLKENIVWLFSVFIIITFFLGGYIFYKYAFLVTSEEVEVKSEVVKIDQVLYKNILSKLNERENNFNNEIRDSRDVFR